MSKAYPKAKDWSPEDLALLVRSEVLAINDLKASQAAGDVLIAKPELQVIHYRKWAIRWQCQGPVSYARYRQLINNELKQMQAAGKFRHSAYAYHPPNYETLEEFDGFMIKMYGGTVPKVDPADMDDFIRQLLRNL